MINRRRRLIGNVLQQMQFAPTILIVLAVSLLGCSGRSAQSKTSREFEPSSYATELQGYLIKLQALIRMYNTEADGIALSEHGVDGRLDDGAAAEMAAFANSILTELNGEFDKPVCRTIGKRWYQVPSRFKLVETKSHDSDAPTFTISHHNCGLHEFDFVVDNDKGSVVADRYDSLGTNW